VSQFLFKSGEMVQGGTHFFGKGALCGTKGTEISAIHFDEANLSLVFDFEHFANYHVICYDKAEFDSFYAHMNPPRMRCTAAPGHPSPGLVNRVKSGQIVLNHGTPKGLGATFDEATKLFDAFAKALNDTPVASIDETCPECYGTGHRFGFGAPCSKGCK
jgi:hypothetical protein